MTSALSMSNNQLQPTTSIKADLGGGGGLRGTTAVPSPLPAPSPPLMPSGAQGVSASTGGTLTGEGACLVRLLQLLSLLLLLLLLLLHLLLLLLLLLPFLLLFLSLPRP